MGGVDREGGRARAPRSPADVAPSPASRSLSPPSMDEPLAWLLHACVCSPSFVTGGLCTWVQAVGDPKPGARECVARFPPPHRPLAPDLSPPAARTPPSSPPGQGRNRLFFLKKEMGRLGSRGRTGGLPFGSGELARRREKTSLSLAGCPLPFVLRTTSAREMLSLPRPAAALFFLWCLRPSVGAMWRGGDLQTGCLLRLMRSNGLPSTPAFHRKCVCPIVLATLVLPVLFYLSGLLLLVLPWGAAYCLPLSFSLK